ncbi:reverse transcriptase [Vairimorpha apis BRL 01]|uniref:Reverse transcriptase n=1 Tax=Vairimorpha apis BRL 01 TaxID=1037528 RepID=T0L6S3_9MICR|nr:reverse transcriptase [Vairimorpha apis BRL 01]
MDPLSKRLNSMFPKVQIPLSDQKSYSTNHLLFIDDLKILAEKEETLQIITTETKRFFSIIRLEMNIEKSATNSLISINDAVFMNNNDCFKYLEIIEDKTSKPTKAYWDLITKKLRNELICFVKPI